MGFNSVSKKQWGVSENLPNISELEEESPRKMESLVIECIKK